MALASGVKAAVKAGLGVTARPVEMMSPDLRVAASVMASCLPDTRYVLSCNPQTVSELAQAIFQSLSQEYHPVHEPRLLRKREIIPSFPEGIC
jgi:DNA-binding transcriptional LysR family regulator